MRPHTEGLEIFHLLKPVRGGFRAQPQNRRADAKFHPLHQAMADSGHLSRLASFSKRNAGSTQTNQDRLLPEPRSALRGIQDSFD